MCIYPLIKLKTLLWRLFDSVSDKYSSGSNKCQKVYAAKLVILVKLSGQQSLPELKDFFLETFVTRSSFFLPT